METFVTLMSQGHTFLIKNTFASDVENGAAVTGTSNYQQRVERINEGMGRIISNELCGEKEEKKK